MNELISKEEVLSLQPKPKEDRYFQTQNLDDAYEYGWRDLLSCIREMQAVQLERLTDDDFETIRIHLSAEKEILCNQRRWKEAEEYERIIDRFMAFADVERQEKR